MIYLKLKERLEWILHQQDLDRAHANENELLAHYERFLQTTNNEEDELVSRFMEKRTSQSYMSDAYKFGDILFKVLTSIGDENRFYRLLVVSDSLHCFRSRPAPTDDCFASVVGGVAYRDLDIEV